VAETPSSPDHTNDNPSLLFESGIYVSCPAFATAVTSYGDGDFVSGMSTNQGFSSGQDRGRASVGYKFRIRPQAISGCRPPRIREQCNDSASDSADDVERDQISIDASLTDFESCISEQSCMEDHLLPSEHPLNRKRAAKSRPVDDNLDELLEMQSLGIKVALPKVKVRRVIMDPLQVHDSPSDTPHALSIASINFVTPDHHLEHVMSNDLQDWLDLVELGGSPTWPQGTTCKQVRTELSRRLRRT
jgi:hypothetical protein